MMNSGSPRLLVIPKADIQMENQEPGSYLEQLLTFRKKKSLFEKVKDVSLAAGKYFKKVRIHNNDCRYIHVYHTSFPTMNASDFP